MPGSQVRAKQPCHSLGLGLSGQTTWGPGGAQLGQGPAVWGTRARNGPCSPRPPESISQAGRQGQSSPWGDAAG